MSIMYGEMLDDYDSDKDEIYNMFCDYFANPIMTKIKNEGQFSMYVSKIYCLLSKECRYIICFTFANNDSIGTIDALKNIKWVNFQTRTLFEQYPSTVHAYQPNGEGAD